MLDSLIFSVKEKLIVNEESPYLLKIQLFFRSSQIPYQSVESLL